MYGGAGTDYLSGGPDRDVFAYRALTDSTRAAPDIIADFARGEDKIDLRGLGFTGIGAGAAAGTKLGYSYDAANDHTIINAVADFKILLAGRIALGATDFIF